MERSPWLVGTGARAGLEKDVQGSRGGGIKRICCLQPPSDELVGLPPSQQEEDIPGTAWGEAMHQEECGQQVKGGSPPPLLCPGEAPSAVLCSVLGCPVQER